MRFSLAVTSLRVRMLQLSPNAKWPPARAKVADGGHMIVSWSRPRRAHIRLQLATAAAEAGPE